MEIYQFSENTAIWEMTSPYYHVSFIIHNCGAESQQSTGHTTARQRKQLCFFTPSQPAQLYQGKAGQHKVQLSTGHTATANFLTPRQLARLYQGKGGTTQCIGQ